MKEQLPEYLRLKEEYYRSLASIDNSDSDEAHDPGRKASEEAFNKTASRKPAKPSIAEPGTLARATSDSRIGVRTKADLDMPKLAAAAGTAAATPPSSTDIRNALVTRSAALLPGLKKSLSDTAKRAAPLKSTGKRKRETVASVLPGQIQIFKNLHFYFFPNNDVHPARRMRIDKAVQRGATWEKNWNSAVTHVILDTSLDYSYLTEFLGVETIPDNIKVVRENWPAECMSFGTLLDSSHRRFLVVRPGLPQLIKAPSMESDKSLHVERVSNSAIRKRALTPPETPGFLGPTAAIAEVPSATVRAGPDRVPDTFQAAGLETSEEFDEAIKQARILQDFSLDEEDGNGRPGSAECQDLTGADDEHMRSTLKLLPKRQVKYNNPSDKFQCMQKHTGDKSASPNLATIEILEKMSDYYEQTKNEWRVRAYRKAIATLRNHPTRVLTKEQALALPNVGERLAAKIEEIASTNRLKRLDNARADPDDQILQTFTKVYGAGIVQASRWVDQGYKTLDELLRNADLTENQTVGIEHFEDFNSRIPRAEVERHADFVRNALLQIDPKFKVIIGGSFRRGSKESGDIDLMITRPDTNAEHLRNVVLNQLVPRLTSDGFLVASLAITSRDDGSKWHGAACLPGLKIWRRIDLLLVPSHELGAALIYWTGNDIINRSLRLLASTKGMRLNQRGLYEGCLRGPGRTRLTEGTLVEGKDEKRIFELLGVPWRPPEHRNA